MNKIQARWLAVSMLIGWNFLLIGYRMRTTGHPYFLFFLWNLFLAFVPYVSSQLALHFHSREKTWLTYCFVLGSILFLPNAPYIITDLFHLRARAEMPLWFDTMVIFSLAASGLALFYLALMDIAKILYQRWGMFWTEACITLTCFLCGFGIYLGRYLRFNSWDVVSNPETLIDEIGDRLINASVHTRTVGVTLLYGAFLLVGYWIIKLFNFPTFAPSHQGSRSFYAKNPDS